MIMRRLFHSTSNVFFSLILGAIAFGFVFLKYPDYMAQILDWASGLKAWLISRGLTAEYNNWIRVLLEERQLVFMGFTIVARIILSIITGSLTWMWDRFQR